MDNSFRSNSSQPFDSDNNIFSSPRSVIALYTSLRILLKMRKELGLEATLEYLEKNVKNLERNNIQMKKAVTEALLFVNTKRIYEKSMF